MSKEQFRNKLIAELYKAGLDTDAMRPVLNALESTMSGFSIETECTALTVHDCNMENLMKVFIATKISEGVAKGTVYNLKLTLSIFADTIGKSLEQITINDIRLWQYNYQQRRNLSNRSMNGVMQRVSSFFRWAYDNEYIERNVMRTWKRMKEAKRQKHALSPIDLEKMISLVDGKDKRAHCALTMLYSTGCRISELINIQVHDIDLLNGQIKVIGKGNKERTVYLNPRAKLSVNAWLQELGYEDGWLFPGRFAGTHVCSNTIADIITDVSHRCGIAMRVTPHTFRHTTATIALAKGCPVETISKMLGHNNVATTMVYAEIDNDSVQAQHTRCIV